MFLLVGKGGGKVIELFIRRNGLWLLCRTGADPIDFIHPHHQI